MLPYDLEAAALHANERARLEILGVSSPFVDGQIAAIAVTRGLTLVTSNSADFAQYSGLVATSWNEPA